MALYLGIDGAGVRTTAIVANEHGKILAKFVGNSIDYKTIGLLTARQNLKSIIRELCNKTGEKSFRCACIGSTALNSRASVKETESLTANIIDADKIILDSSIFTAMECMLGTGPCALVISGIDSMVAARSSKGKMTNAGGWGYLLGNEGSGYAIAMDAIRHAIRVYEGSEEPSKLLEEMLEFFDVYNPAELKEKFYDPVTERSKISAFAGRVFSCASAGDKKSLEIISDHARLLAGSTISLLKKFPADTSIGLWGGVFVYNRRFRNEFASAMYSQSPDYKIELLNYPAECGALFAAYKMDSIEISGELMKNIDLYRGVRV